MICEKNNSKGLIKRAYKTMHRYFNLSQTIDFNLEFKTKYCCTFFMEQIYDKYVNHYKRDFYLYNSSYNKEYMNQKFPNI